MASVCSVYNGNLFGRYIYEELHEAYLYYTKGAGMHHGLCCRSLSRQVAGIAFRAVAEHEKA
ncbi:hypothetical protein A343_1328 [Porphyromonas gingivalis JCVI SC001]|nr:hypothetical protein A343_1328 [Porphyromonas gingivalis JCVI SC001]